ncbi:glycosyltransferase [Marinivivus vitaminiproducens]|uniref:glycosyltransferase n=1 Tax=Marinivivus vitaminiproducens TaxID=3035935 RepID=UPI0027987F1E|nr:glycosyltransferase [Geminicoccaceae bacterium SCSIO 64248]
MSIIHAPRWGGIHTIMERAGPLCGQSGWPWTVVLPAADDGDNGRKRLEAAGLNVVEIPLRRLRKTLNPLTHLKFLATIPIDVIRLMRIIKDYDIDVVQVCGLIHFHGALAARLANKPLVWQLHSDQPPAFLKRIFSPWVRSLSHVSMTAGQKIIGKHSGLSRMEPPPYVFFAPVDLNRFRPDALMRSQARHRMGVGDGAGEIVVGTVGGRGPNKNHAMIVRVAAALRDHEPRLRYALCGHWLPQHRAYYQREVIDLAEREGLLESGIVRFVEPGSEVSLYMNGFDLFALSSHGEGISVVTAEAMATGLPVVVNDVGSMSDFVQDGDVGYLNRSLTVDEMARHILALARDDATRHKMGQHALAYARSHLDARVCANVHIEAYQCAIERQRAITMPSARTS